MGYVFWYDYYVNDHCYTYILNTFFSVWNITDKKFNSITLNNTNQDMQSHLVPQMNTPKNDLVEENKTMLLLKIILVSEYSLSSTILVNFMCGCYDES